MKTTSHVLLSFAFCAAAFSVSAETYYYWGDATNGNMPIFPASAWSSSSSEYVAIPENANVNSPDANWVFDYNAHLPTAARKEGIYFNIAN